MEEISEELMGYVHIALQKAEVYELEVEVITTALVYIQNNPGTSIAEALSYGLLEWIK